MHTCMRFVSMPFCAFCNIRRSGFRRRRAKKRGRHGSSVNNTRARIHRATKTGFENYFQNLCAFGLGGCTHHRQNPSFAGPSWNRAPVFRLESRNTRITRIARIASVPLSLSVLIRWEKRVNMRVNLANLLPHNSPKRCHPGVRRSTPKSGAARCRPFQRGIGCHTKLTRPCDLNLLIQNPVAS